VQSRASYGPLFVSCGFHHFLNTWDKDLAGGIDELAHDGNEVGHRLVHCSPEYAGMQIASWPGDVDLEI